MATRPKRVAKLQFGTNIILSLSTDVSVYADVLVQSLCFCYSVCPHDCMCICMCACLALFILQPHLVMQINLRGGYTHCFILHVGIDTKQTATDRKFCSYFSFGVMHVRYDHSRKKRRQRRTYVHLRNNIDNFRHIINLSKSIFRSLLIFGFLQFLRLGMSASVW